MKCLSLKTRRSFCVQHIRSLMIKKPSANIFYYFVLDANRVWLLMKKLLQSLWGMKLSNADYRKCGTWERHLAEYAPYTRT